jgi:FkbM family methyltransferase
MFATIKRRIKKWLEPSLRLEIKPLTKQIHLGTDYGGYTIPEGLLNEYSVYYAVGAGEDISLDVEIANRFNPSIYILDPTPRAQTHFEMLKNNASKGIPTPLYKNYTYPLLPDTFQKTTFVPLGLWNQKTTMKFFAPANENHVSHSLLNMQQTENYIEVPVDSLDHIMQTFGHTALDMLKIDIEGAEFAVLEDLIAKKIDVKLICLEYHRQGDKPIERIQESIDMLVNNGYRAIQGDKNMLTFSFLRKDIFEQLR